MFKRILLASVLLTGGMASAHERPASLSIYTWTREDIFAGLLSGNMERLNVGMRKLDNILTENPKDPDAMVMKALGITIYGAWDLESGNSSGFNEKYAE